jgi:hypothetical protein
VTKAVLAIGLRDDPHVQAVGLAVSELGADFILWDPSEDEVLLFTCANHSLGSLVWLDGKTLFIDSIVSVFCRYAIDGLRPSAEISDLRRYGMFEKLQGFFAALRCIGSDRWINDPWMEARSDCKILQRHLAQKLGLRTPKQIISNDISEIQDYFAGLPSVVKPLSDTSLGVTKDEAFCNRPISSSNFVAPFTARFDATLASGILSDGTPLLVQEEIEKVADLRCMVLDNYVESFAIEYVKGQPIDFRIAQIGRVESFELKPETKDQLIALNHELKVRFSACDLILSRGGEEVFLEANVSGNWLFCDIANDMRVTREIARKLVTKHRSVSK